MKTTLPQTTSLLGRVNFKHFGLALLLSCGLSTLHALDLTWDPDGSGGIQGGSGTWDTSLLNWTNDGGTSHVAWTNSSPTNTATFAGTDGTYTITVNGISRADGITFNASGYTLEAASAENITNAGNITVASGKSATIGNNITLYRGSSYGLSGGGTLYVTSGGTVDGGASFTIREGGSVILNGGNLTVGNSQRLILGTSSADPDSILTINSGTAFGGSSTGNVGTRFSGNGIINLNGGKLRTTRFFSDSAASTRVLNLNGGELEVSGTTDLGGADFMDGLTSVNVMDNGAVIDTNGFSVVATPALAHAGTNATDGGLTKQGAGTLTLSGANTYTGDTTIDGGTLTLADGGQLSFFIGADGINNSILGTGILNLDGDISFDLSGAGTSGSDSWLIVDVGSLTESYGITFSVLGFTEDAGIWSGDFNDTTYVFTESTGILSVVPEPSTWSLLGGIAALSLALWRRRAKLSA